MQELDTLNLTLDTFHLKLLKKMLYFLILVISAIASYFLPWWVIAPIAFLLCAWKAEDGLKAYAIPAAAITTLWVAYATYLNVSTGGVISQNIGHLFTANSPFLQKLPTVGLLMFVMTLIGANVAGFAGLAGFHFRQLLKK